jgi:hypothetical protein
MKQKIVIWTNKVVPNACSLYKLEGVEDDYELKKGVSRLLSFPEKAVYNMHPDRPTNTLLTDNLFNTASLIVGSRRLRDLFERHAVPAVEYLPVTILNHKGKALGKEYYIINPVGLVDCIDVQKSKIKWDPMDEFMIEEVSRLVIDEAKVEPDRIVFRPKGYHWIVLVRREFAATVATEGITGVQWVELDEFSE